MRAIHVACDARGTCSVRGIRDLFGSDPSAGGDCSTGVLFDERVISSCGSMCLASGRVCSWDGAHGGELECAAATHIDATHELAAADVPIRHPLAERSRSRVLCYATDLLQSTAFCTMGGAVCGGSCGL